MNLRLLRVILIQMGRELRETPLRIFKCQLAHYQRQLVGECQVGRRGEHIR